MMRRRELLLKDPSRNMNDVDGEMLRGLVTLLCYRDACHGQSTFRSIAREGSIV
jgi:hypothetical protein